MPIRDAAHPNLYRVLGLEHGADAHALRAAYARLVRLHHPDTHGYLPARLEEVQHAYRVLSDNEARAAYDRSLFEAEREHLARRHRLHDRLRGYDGRHPHGEPAGPRHWGFALAAALVAAAALAAAWLLGPL